MCSCFWIKRHVLDQLQLEAWLMPIPEGSLAWREIKKESKSKEKLAGIDHWASLSTKITLINHCYTQMWCLKYIKNPNKSGWTLSLGPNTSVFLSWCVLVGVTRTQKRLPQMSLKTLERANCGEFETQIETPQEYYAHLKTIWIGSRLSPGRMWREKEAIRQLGLDQKERPRLLCKMKKVGSWGGGSFDAWYRFCPLDSSRCDVRGKWPVPAVLSRAP